MKNLILAIGLVLSLSAHAANDSLSRLVSCELKQSYTREELKDVWKKYKIPQAVLPVRYGMDIYEVIYTTQWHDGTPIKASGVLFVPKSPKKTPPMMIYHHGTRIKKARPIGLDDIEQAICMGFAVDGYIVCMPDYIGLGKGEKFHLYQHAESEAQASVDLLRAVNEILKQKNIATDGKLFISGYSQGGHAAMALHKILQERYKGEFTVTASSPMSGPYDLSGVQSEVMFKNYTHPGYLPYLLNSYQEVYHLIDEDILTIYNSPYDTVVRHFYTGEFEMDTINHFLPKVPKEMIRAEYLDRYVNDSTFELHHALAENNVYDWKPEAPMQLCFCKADEQVTYKNSIVAYETMTKNGSKSVSLRNGGKRFGHFTCALYSCMNTKLYFDSIRNGHKKGTRGNVFKRILIGIGKSAQKN